MKIKDLLKLGREIWGEKKMTLSEIIVAMGVVYGDICRVERGAKKDYLLKRDLELKKEFGNLIFSTIRWANDLGLDPKDCINEAIKAQRKFKR